MVPLEVEAWIWYGVALSIVLARFVARYLQFKTIKRFQLEDIIMGAVVLIYTAVVVLTLRANVTPTNLIPMEQLEHLTDMDVQDRINGSKLIIALEQLFIATQWLCKACILLFYHNLTIGLRQHLFVKLVAAYTTFAWILMEILYFSVWCRPFHNYWSVPAASPQCSTYFNHLITNFVLNVSSDLLIIMIPLPMLARTHLPLRKKLLLCCLFSVGFFVIISACLNKYASIAQPYSSLWVYWYVREISTAVIVPNLPHGWVLLRKVFRLRSFLQSDDSDRQGSVFGAISGSPRLNVCPIARVDTVGTRRSTRQMSDISRALEAIRNMPQEPNDSDSLEVIGSRPIGGQNLSNWQKKDFRLDINKGRGSEGSSSSTSGEDNMDDLKSRDGMDSGIGVGEMGRISESTGSIARRESTENDMELRKASSNGEC